MFGGLTQESVRQMFFNLGYHAHGGSGLGYSWDVVAEMPVDEIIWNLRKLDETRTEEGKKIRAAHGVR